MSTVAPAGLEPEVTEALQAGLGDGLGRSVTITLLDRRTIKASSHPLEWLNVRLSSGEELQVVFKRLTGRHLGARQREVLVYRHLLPEVPLAAPRLYASVYDEEGGRYWLFLEALGFRRIVRRTRGFAAAALILARLHATFHGREHELVEHGFLVDQQDWYYENILRDARRQLEGQTGPDLLERFDELNAGYGALAAELCAQPRTLVHGDVYGDNFILDPQGSVWGLDWELAGVGLAPLDLAHLMFAWDSHRTEFVDAYAGEYRRRAALPWSTCDFERLLAACGVVVSLRYGGWVGGGHTGEGFLAELARAWERFRAFG